MQGFLEFMKVGMVCGTFCFLGFVALLALPQSRLRSVLLEVAKWGLAFACGLLIVSPIDFVPDVLPVLGWADDLGYAAGALVSIKAALDERRRRPQLEA